MKLNFKTDALDKLEKEAATKESAGNILIIDDEPENLYALEKTLSSEYTVFATTSPEEALKTVKDKRVDVILTDQRMPEMIGTELLKLVKKENDDNVRMILTGYTDVKDLIDCIKSGLIYRYLVKPWDSEEIKSVVAQSMNVIASKRTMDRMLPTQIVDRLYPKGMQSVKEGFGKELECAILFLDIRNFTGLAESMDANSTFQLLTSFIRIVGPIINHNHGFIDKYLGDGLLAIFDRENQFSDDVLNCLEEVAEVVAKYNQEKKELEKENFKIVEYGVGVSYGRVILGTVGFHGRIDFTVLGDAVNTASRLESFTKELGVHMLVHSRILEYSKNKKPVHRKIGKVKMRGKKESTPVTEVLNSDPPEIQKLKLQNAELINKGIEALNGNNFDSAKANQKKALEIYPEDSLVKYFLNNLYQEH